MINLWLKDYFYIFGALIFQVTFFLNSSIIQILIIAKATISLDDEDLSCLNFFGLPFRDYYDIANDNASIENSKCMNT